MATKKKTDRVFENPFPATFMPMWEYWKEYKLAEFKFKYKSIISEQAAINLLKELSAGQEDVASLIIKQSIENGWKGFFALKNNYATTNQRHTGAAPVPRIVDQGGFGQL